MLKLFNQVVSLINNDLIGTLTLIISLLTFLYMLYTNRFRLKITLIPNNMITYSEVDDYPYSYGVKCHIENKSQIPISIFNIKLNNYDVFKFETTICGNGISMFGKLFDDVYKTFNYPLKLEPYDAKKGILLFCYDKKLKLKKYNLLRIYTARGIVYKIVKYNTKN